MWLQLSEIFLLGLIGGSVPGPILTATFTEVLNSGFKKSLKVIGRALIAETLVATAIIVVLSSIGIPDLYFHILSILGTGVLIWIAINVWKIKKIGDQKGEIFPFSKILLLTILNGGFWIFWLTVSVPRAFLLKETLSGGEFLFILIFEIGWLLMTGLYAFVFSFFRPLLLKKKLVSIVFKIFALILIFFAAKSVISSIIFFLKN